MATHFRSDVVIRKNLKVEGDFSVDGSFEYENLSITGTANLANLVRGEKYLNIDYGTAQLTNDTTTAITTALSEVLVVVATEATEATTTPASKILAYVGTGANKNKIYLKAKGAEGTTTVNWIAIGKV